MPPGYPAASATPLAGGVPWESHELGLLSRWWETFKAVNFHGRAFFAAARQGNDAVSACVFNTMSGAIWGFAIGFLMFLFMLLVGAVGIAQGAAQKMPGMGGAVAGVSIGIGLLYVVFTVTIGAAIGFVGPWVHGGIHHLLLLMFGGTASDKGYEHTVRAYAFAIGAATPWFLIPVPFLNSLMVAVFAFINLLVGYDETHQAGMGKVLFALFAPVLLCCGCYMMLAILGTAGR
jgi:hypothetical protein